jgi:hypothetical protein
VNAEASAIVPIAPSKNVVNSAADETGQDISAALVHLSVGYVAGAMPVQR